MVDFEIEIIVQPSRLEFARRIHEWALTGKPTSLEFTAMEDGVIRKFKADVQSISSGAEGSYTIGAHARYDDKRGFLRIINFDVEFGIEPDE